MSKWIKLQCPTCGGNLQIAGDTVRFTCDHCGIAYLLERKADEIIHTGHEQLAALTTYTHRLQQWLKVGKHEIFVHEILEEQVQKERMIFVNVEYRNNSQEMLSCRRNQWVLFDTEGYTYDTLSNSTPLETTGHPPLGGERFINPGMRVRGWVAFKLPPSATLERLQFLSGFLGTKTAEFLLER